MMMVRQRRCQREFFLLLDICSAIVALDIMLCLSVMDFPISGLFIC